ncbi:MAG TPA: hypothetical protein VMH87_05510 [Pseudomonadales bacterium]|nr:hypothetical protein [Pseudomonadales bacterium]
MKLKGETKLLFAATIAAAFGMSASSVLAQNINTVQTTVASGTAGVSLTSDPVITAILSAPGTVNGKTYTSWSFLVNDGTGSMDVFGSTLPGGYTPVVGDALSLTGTYSPFHQIPEMASLTSLSVVSSGNPLPSIGTSTIPTLNQAVLPYNVAGYLWQLDNVTVSGQGSGNWGTANSPTGAMISDGANSMTLFYWPTSYSSANANMANTPIPTGPVDMVGFVSVFNSVAEFTPISVTSVPEPTTLSLCGIGGLLLLKLSQRPRRRN